MNATHPTVYYRSDLGGIRVGMGLARKIKAIQKYRGHPDFQVFRPIKDYAGLLLELKDKRSDVFLVRGGLPKGKAIHLLEQVAMILMLRCDGYAADLAIGQAQAERQINHYLQGRLTYTGNPEQVIAEATPQQIKEAAIEHPLVYDFIYSIKGETG